MDTPFKTPQSRILKRSNEAIYTPRALSERSDSDESISSKSSKCGSISDLTVVALYDDLMRLMSNKRDKRTERSFEAFAQESQLLLERYCELFQECQRLQALVNLKVDECSESEHRMNNARLLLDEEKKKTRRVLHENRRLQEQLDQVKELLLKDNMKINEEAKQKLLFLDTHNGCERNLRNLSRINEVNSTGSMLSEFSFSQSENGLDTSEHPCNNNERVWKRRSGAAGETDPPVKKRKSGHKAVEIGVADTVRTTTTVTVNKKGPITATSVIESIPYTNGTDFEKPTPSSDDGIGSTAPSMPPAHMVFESWAKNSSPACNQPRAPKRQHSLQQKTLIGGDVCACCQKKLRFGKTALKCKECRSLCHTECADLLPLPCVPLVDTPNHKNLLKVISNYAPSQSPMVPALIVHCTNEIELRGLKELGLYRISASEKEVRSLKEKFLKGRGYPSIVQTDIHVLCGCVKDFLRMLTEPLVTYGRWKDFVHAVEAKDQQDVVPALIQCVSELPQPNRDTLAYMMLHLQKVAQAPECKMPIENLAKVFGPTIVGYSSDNPSTETLISETMKQIKVLDCLIRLPGDYWARFVDVAPEPPTSGLIQTPSTDSLFLARLFTPNGARSTAKKQRYFHTPPAYKL
ncbi:hypothetical protein HUJ04_001171 [Dendroctonus ponderosae]